MTRATALVLLMIGLFAAAIYLVLKRPAEGLQAPKPADSLWGDLFSIGKSIFSPTGGSSSSAPPRPKAEQDAALGAFDRTSPDYTPDDVSADCFLFGKNC